MVELTQGEARAYETYMATRDKRKAAAMMGIKIESFTSIISSLVKKGVLKKDGKVHKPTGQPYKVRMPQEAFRQTMHRRMQYPMTEAEREWMIRNYKKYRTRRGEVARILGRSRFEVNMMAISLGLSKEA